MFEITSDLEFYCYLKYHLPEGWEIVAEPQKGYYTEEVFHYKLYHNGQQVDECVGGFRGLKEGELIEAAKRILEAT